jgi:hypothetical protein
MAAFLAQVLQGMGGGSAVLAVQVLPKYAETMCPPNTHHFQVGAQASVPHEDVAMVTAFIMLLAELGGALGGAIGTPT